MDPNNRKRIKKNIDSYGCHIIKVLEEDGLPSFGYSIGLYERFGHSEILFVGLNLNLTHNLINSLASKILNGSKLLFGTFQPDIIDHFDCYITNVLEIYYDEYVGQAIDYYGTKNFPLIQCIYPTVKGVYPWQKEWPEEIQYLQPILGHHL